ncbi:hypothetical protein LH446_15290, partial [Laribacter hongkongensis]
MTSLHQLEHHDEFVERHIGPAENEIAAMLATVGAGSLDDLVAQTIPADILRADLLPLPAAVAEHAALAD